MAYELEVCKSNGDPADPRGAGEAKRAEDPNNAGQDDLVGIVLVFAADLLDWVINGKQKPKVPDAVR